MKQTGAASKKSQRIEASKKTERQNRLNITLESKRPVKKALKRRKREKPQTAVLEKVVPPITTPMKIGPHILPVVKVVTPWASEIANGILKMLPWIILAVGVTITMVIVAIQRPDAAAEILPAMIEHLVQGWKGP